MLAFPQFLGAQTPLEKLYQERLSDGELRQLSGHGSVLPSVRLEQPVNSIKLWDEWAKPQQQGLSNSTGLNQVVVIGPGR